MTCVPITSDNSLSLTSRSHSLYQSVFRGCLVWTVHEVISFEVVSFVCCPHAVLRWFRLRWFRLFAVHMLSTRWFHFGREVISLLDVTSTSHAYIIIVSIQSIFQMPLTTPLRHKKLKFKLVNNGVRRLNAVGCDFSQVYMLCRDAFQRGVRCLYIKNWRCVIWGGLCPLGVHEVISFEVISPLCCPHDNLGVFEVISFEVISSLCCPRGDLECFWGDFNWGDFKEELSTKFETLNTLW